MSSTKQKTGTVEQLKSGRWSVRLTYADGTRERLKGTFATEEEAREVCAAAIDELGLNETTGLTLAGIADRFHDDRELSGKRSSDDGRSVWRTWIETAPFYRRPLRTHSEREVRRWAKSIWSKRAEQTARNALNLLRVAYEWAVEDEILKENPARDVRLPSKARTEEPWTYLLQSEIPGRLIDIATPEEWDLICFAWGTGLRSGEQRSLLLRDVHVRKVMDPHVTVRFGNPGQPTKTGTIRHVPLFGPALAAMEHWLDRLPSFCRDRHGKDLNERGLAFPTARGAVRPEGHLLGRVYLGRTPEGKQRYVDRWTTLAREAGLFDANPERPLVWHSLRHTCASWCVSGWWGRRWTLEEVKELLGHESITTTERYAHFGETALKQAAREARSAGGSGGLAAVHAASTAILEWLESPYFPAPPAGIGPATFGLGSGSVPEVLPALAPQPGRLVDALREAGARGDNAAAWAAGAALVRETLTRGAAAQALRALMGGPHTFERLLDLADAVESEGALRMSASG